MNQEPKMSNKELLAKVYTKKLLDVEAEWYCQTSEHFKFTMNDVLKTHTEEELVLKVLSI